MESHVAAPQRTPPPLPPKTSPLRASAGTKVQLPNSRGAAPQITSSAAGAGASPLPPPPRSTPRGERHRGLGVHPHHLQLESPRKDEALSEVLQAPLPRRDVVDKHPLRAGDAGPSAVPGGPVRKVHNPMPTHAPLPMLQPSGMSSSSGSSAQQRAAVVQQVAPQQPILVTGPTPMATTAAAALQEDPGQRVTVQQQQLRRAGAMESLQISVVVKGTSQDKLVAVPPPRVMELSLHDAAVTVREVVEQCLAMVASACTAGVVVASATLEQRGQPIPDASQLLSVSDATELYFLSIAYASQQSLSSRAVAPPVNPGSSPAPALPPASTVVEPATALLRSLEHRLSAVESFVRSHSEQRSDSGDRHHDAIESDTLMMGRSSQASDGKRMQLPTKYATPPYYKDPSATRLDQAAAGTLQSMPTVSPIERGQRRQDPRDGDNGSWLSPRTAVDGSSDRRPTPLDGKGPYTMQAEKLEYLALTNRQERLERLDQIKRLIADKVDLYQWMTDVLDTPRHTVEYNVHARLPQAGADRQGIGSSAVGAQQRQKSTPAVFATPRCDLMTPRPLDHDNVHVDYDPVLDIWKLRKGPPV